MLVKTSLYTVVLYALLNQTLAYGESATKVHTQLAKNQTELLLIRGGWLFDSVSNNRRINQGLLIAAGKIQAVDVTAEQKKLADAKVIELDKSDTITAGLVDL